MRHYLFLHYGWFFQNLGKEAVPTFMHTTVAQGIEFVLITSLLLRSSCLLILNYFYFSGGTGPFSPQQDCHVKSAPREKMADLLQSKRQPRPAGLHQPQQRPGILYRQHHPAIRPRLQW